MSYQTVPIQDRVDIDNLFSAYAYTLDDGNANGWIALHTEDGAFDVPGLNRFESPEGLRAIADIVIEGSQGNWRHIVTNEPVTPGASGDEVAVLATAFNHMVERLERELQAQRETNQGMLRTERLAIAGSLAAGVAHEVNNPLASVSSLVQLVRERSDDPEAREMLEEAIGQIERISGVLHELLTFARPPGRALVDVELYEVLEATVRLLRYDKRVRSVELELARHDEEGPLLAIAETKLFAIFALHLGLVFFFPARSASAAINTISTR